MKLRAAPLLLCLCHASAATAIGLGELDVRSPLGQPLHATVRILEPGAAGADCFRVLPADAGGAAPLRAQLELERAGDTALLHLRSRQAINEPFVQFVLAFECGPPLRREYVALPDPPSVAQAPTLSPLAPAAVNVSSPPAPPEPARAERPRAARPSVRRAVPAQATPTRAQAPASDDGPRLVLSGRRMASQGSGAFALKLDTNLPDLDRPLEPALTATELSDENTALTRKLAHLEAQLVELQQRNAELEARRAAAPAVAPEPPPGRATWPLALLGLAGFAGIAGLAAWLRRRGQAHAPPVADYDFSEAWTLPQRPETTSPAPAPANSPAPASATEAPPTPLPPGLEFNRPLQEDMTEVKDDILDQAEVYMAHGHSDLAIHLLREHLREAPTESPVPWLLLLDLLQRDGDLEGYTAACKDCRAHFNINLADHPAANQADQGEGLEAYPHLLNRLTEMWRSPDLDAFFDDLIYDHRGGTRMGFAPMAYREILLLRSIAQDTREAA